MRRNLIHLDIQKVYLQNTSPYSTVEWLCYNKIINNFYWFWSHLSARYWFSWKMILSAFSTTEAMCSFVPFDIVEANLNYSLIIPYSIFTNLPINSLAGVCKKRKLDWKVLHVMCFQWTGCCSKTWKLTF